MLLFVGQLGIPPAQFGLVFVAASFSSLLGSLAIQPLRRQAGLGPVMVLATVLLAAGVLVRVVAAFARPPLTYPLLVGSSLVGGFGLMTYNVPCCRSSRR